MADSEDLDYSDDFVADGPLSASRSSGVVRRGLIRRRGRALTEDYAEDFEDGSMQESATSQHSSGSERRRSSAMSSQLHTHRSQEEPEYGEGSHRSGVSSPLPREDQAAEAAGAVPPPRSRTPTPTPDLQQHIGIPKPPEARPQAPEARPEAPEVRPEAPEVRPEVPPIALPKPQHARPVPQLPTPAEQWRAPELELEKRCAPPAPPMPPTPTPPSSSQRSHDALPRRLKPHTWDIAALGGDEPKSPQERSDRPKTQQPIGMHKPPMALAVEAEVVDHLLSRFVLERKAPTLQRRERKAYKEMLEQVAWTALEPKAAQEAAVLLSKHWLAPVTANEALRAFRRCLHRILCDERVLDIVEHEMSLNFSRAGKKAETGMS